MGSICTYNTPYMLFLALGFAIIYWFDIRSTKERKSPFWWLKLRAPLNTFAIFSLTVMGFNE